MHPTRASTGSKIEDALIIPPRLTLPCKRNIPYREAYQAPAEKSLSSLDTVRMPSVRQRKQQDTLTNTMVEDIALQATLKLPVITLVLENQAQSDQRKVIASTAGGAAIVGAGDLIFAALRYVINVVMTNIVSQSVYGTYTSVYTSALIVGSIAALGLDSTIVRFLSIYRAKDEYGLAAGLLRLVVWMTLISSLLCSALFYLSATALAHLVYHQDAYALPLKEVASLIPFVALQLVFSNGLLALKAIKSKVFVDRLIQPVLSLILIGVFYRLGLRLEALILATTCGLLASVITGQILLRKAPERRVQDAAPRFDIKTWLRFALPMSFSSLIQNVMNSADILFLTAFTTAAQVGLYSAADRTSSFVLIPLFALNIIFSPLIAEYFTRGEHEQLARLAQVITKWSFSLSLPVCLCFCIFHEAILSIFSKGYTAASASLIILSFGNLVNAGTGSTGYLLAMTGHARVILINTIAAIMANIGLSILLIPRFNIVGAAVASSLAMVMLNIAYFIQAYWILKTIILRWDMLKPAAAGAVASIAGLLLLHVIHVGYGYRAIFGTLGLVISFMLVYVFTLALLRFSKEDMMVFNAILAKLGRKKHI